VYPCVCTRREVGTLQSAPHAGEEGLYYPGICRGRFADYRAAEAALGGGRLPVWRFRTPVRETFFEDGFKGPQRQTVAETVGDFPLARDADGAGYMLAVVVDDAAMGVTEVLRGDDLLGATHRQLLLQEALGLPAPRYVHVPLVVAEDGRRLAKRHGDTRIASLREAGCSPGQVVGLLAWWCGWADYGATVHPGELAPGFRLETLLQRPAVLTPAILRGLGMPA
jgi:glutamyl-tRNA synthetase